jgi:hypothetical protein
MRRTVADVVTVIAEPVLPALLVTAEGRAEDREKGVTTQAAAKRRLAA